MILFLLKGLLRDRSRSLFPVIIIVSGVILTVFFHGWIRGYENNFTESTASFDSGHMKVMSRAYSELQDQIPNDLALLGIDSLLSDLNKQWSDVLWMPRIRFGGLLDIPDENGETRAQGPAFGFGVALLNPASKERQILNLDKSIISGRLPQNPGEILISDEFAQRLKTKPGETATLIGSTMYGSMATYNFKIVGTIRFGINALDQRAILADIHDIQQALDMQNAAAEILGFFPDFVYRTELSEEITRNFNQQFPDSTDEFSPIMVSLSQQAGLQQIIQMVKSFNSVILVMFIFVMSIVLWNAGLMGSLRRYGEIGVRLAIGEYKGHIYRAMLMEALMIGIIGTILGTTIGLAISYYVQANGLDFSSIMKDSSILISSVWHTKVTSEAYFIGFIPGILATLIGTSISGIGIYKRETSQLVKELEA